VRRPTSNRNDHIVRGLPDVERIDDITAIAFQPRPQPVTEKDGATRGRQFSFDGGARRRTAKQIGSQKMNERTS
jgi:hypothetical protein